MVVSLAFGVLFATVLTLILIPAWYMILTDVISTKHMRERNAIRNSEEIFGEINE